MSRGHTTSNLVRAALLGLASGSRSTVGVSALTITRGHPTTRSTRWPIADGPWPTRVAVLATAGELVGDKLPQTPSRLEPAGFGARLVLGGVSGWTIACREGADRNRCLAAAGIGLAAAAVGTRLGAGWRAAAAARVGADLPGAIVEDLAALGLACTAVAAVRTAAR